MAAAEAEEAAFELRPGWVRIRTLDFEAGDGGLTHCLADLFWSRDLPQIGDRARGRRDGDAVAPRDIFSCERA